MTSVCIYATGALYELLTGSFFSYYHSSSFTAYHIPTLLGIAYTSVLFAHDNKSTKSTRFLLLKKIALSALCIACIAIFCIHPVGRFAWIYSLLWVLPAINLFLSHSSFFIHALASVCAIHAFGSVIWIYTHQTTSLFWIALLPITYVERLLFATGALAIEKTYPFLFSWLSRYTVSSCAALRCLAARAQRRLRLLHNRSSYISLFVLITVFI